MIHCYCDYDPPEWFNERVVSRARKPYRCSECSGPISPGEPYKYTIGKWDGYVEQFRTCERCHDCRQWLLNNLPCYCWAYGDNFEDALGYVEDAQYRAPDETKGLRFGFLRRLAIRDRFNRAARI